MIFPRGISEWKVFCSFDNEDGTNCQNEAVGELTFYLNNNPLPGKGITKLPICQEHLDKHPKL